MSKIEEALKKAKQIENDESDGRQIAPYDKNEPNIEVPPGSSISSMQYKSSIEQIALMDDGPLYDNKELDELKIIHPEMDDKEVANRFRDLRTKILQRSGGNNAIVMFTSCIDDDNSRQTALNLAAAFSFDESKSSLFIDCKLNDMKSDKILNISCSKGITDYLLDENIDVDSILYKSGVARLKLIPAGSLKEASKEFFTSMRMRELMSQLLDRYSDRYIFMDTDPVSYAADTRILVDLCDYVILTVPYGKVTSKRLQESVSAIDQDKFLGVIFTDVPKLPGFDLSSIFNLGFNKNTKEKY